MVFRQFDSITQLLQVLGEFIEKYEERNLHLVKALSTEERKRYSAIGSLDILKHLKSVITVVSEQKTTQE